MNLFELFNPATSGYTDLEDDNDSNRKLTDLRKTKLTLRQINKIRRMNDVRTYEQRTKLAKVKKQYSSPVEGGEMPGL